MAVLLITCDFTVSETYTREREGGRAATRYKCYLFFCESTRVFEETDGWFRLRRNGNTWILLSTSEGL